MDDLTVLIVDDDDVARCALKRLLLNSPRQINVEECDSGETALEFLNRCVEAPEQRLPAAIYLDLAMPYVNGIEFLAEFASRMDVYPQFGEIAVFIVSGVDDHASFVHCKQNPSVRAFVNKWLNQETFESVMNTHCPQIFAVDPQIAAVS